MIGKIVEICPLNWFGNCSARVFNVLNQLKQWNYGLLAWNNSPTGCLEHWSSGQMSHLPNKNCLVKLLKNVFSALLINIYRRRIKFIFEAMVYICSKALVQFKVSTTLCNNPQKCRGQRSISTKRIRSWCENSPHRTLQQISQSAIFLCANSQMHDTILFNWEKLL